MTRQLVRATVGTAGSIDIHSAHTNMRPSKLMVRLSTDEKAVLEDAATREGLKAASWARRTLLRAVREQENPPYSGSANGQQRGLLSLFCGPGGLDLGFKEAGFQTLVGIDVDEDCVRTFAHNHPTARAGIRDITGLSVTGIDELYGRPLEPIGVLGGPPCQSFSISNVHQTNDDPRHLLPESYASLLSQLNDRNPISFFVFENVPGLLGKKHVHRYGRFKNLFEQAGFHLEEALLDAQDFGVPQVRPRIIIVGINQKLHPNKKWIPPKPTHERVTVRDAIYGLPEPVQNARGLDPATFAVHPNHWCLVPKSSKFSNGSLKEGEMWGRSFRSLRWDEPSWTVAYGHREVHVHPNGRRRLSIYEALLLQTFPPTYRLLGNMSAQVRLVSDAVPPKLAHHIALSIREVLGI